MDKGNGMIMDTAGRRESLGSGKDCLMFRKEGLEVLGHGWDLCGLYGVELGYDTIGSDRATIGNHDLEIIDSMNIAMGFLGDATMNKIVGPATINQDDDLSVLDVTD